MGWIEVLEKVCSLKGHTQDLEHKLVEQDHVIANLVDDNLNHLQNNMRLMAHINSLQTRMANLEQKLMELGELFLAAMGQSSLEQGMLDAGGNNEDDQDRGESSGGAGVFPLGSTRPGTPALREEGLVVQMEREVREAGLGGWFNRMDWELPESWSVPNSDTSSTQDRVGTTSLTTVGSQTLPNKVREIGRASGRERVLMSV